MKFNDPYWEKYSAEKRIIRCYWCDKEINLEDAKFVPNGLSRHRPLCKECDANSTVIECRHKYPTNEQLGIPSRRE